MINSIINKYILVALLVLFVSNAHSKIFQERFGSEINNIEGIIESWETDTRLKHLFRRGLEDLPVTLDIVNSDGDIIYSRLGRSNSNGLFVFGGVKEYRGRDDLTFNISYTIRNRHVSMKNYDGADFVQRFTYDSNPFFRTRIIDTSSQAFHFSSAVHFMEWVKGLNMLGEKYDKIFIKISSQEEIEENDANKEAGMSSYPVVCRACVSGNTIGIVSSNLDQGTLAHEIGHVLLNSQDIYGSRGRHKEMCGKDGCVVGPDGVKISNDNSPGRVLHEEWADFFKVAALNENYPDLFMKNSYEVDNFELNIGGRDVYIGSTKKYDNSYAANVGVQTGSDGRNYFIYPYDAPLAYSGSYSSVLWDFYDKNEYRGPIHYVRDFGIPGGSRKNNDEGVRSKVISFSSKLNDISFSDVLYMDAHNDGYFNEQATKDREDDFDRVSVKIIDLFNAIVRQKEHSHLSISARLNMPNSGLDLDADDANDIFRLHNNYSRIRHANITSGFIRHRDEDALLTAITNSVDEYESEWVFVASLAQPDDPEMVSIESVRNPGRYLRVVDDRIFQHLDLEDSVSFAEESSWIIHRQNIDGERVVSFESVAFPGFFISIDGLSKSLKLMPITDNRQDQQFVIEAVLPGFMQ